MSQVSLLASGTISIIFNETRPTWEKFKQHRVDCLRWRASAPVTSKAVVPVQRRERFIHRPRSTHARCLPPSAF